MIWYIHVYIHEYIIYIYILIYTSNLNLSNFSSIQYAISIYLSTYLSFYLSVYVCIYLSLYIYIYIYIYISCQNKDWLAKFPRNLGHDDHIILDCYSKYILSYKIINTARQKFLCNNIVFILSIWLAVDFQ